MKLPYSDVIMLALKVALVAIVLFGGFRAYRMGQAQKEAEWSAKYDTLVADTHAASLEETVRQTEANRRARAKADATLVALQRSEEARASLIKDLHGQALADRNAGRECLGTDSLRRINKATPGSG